jgi:hypothetical protein
MAEEHSMNARIFTGTLYGPEGTTVGRFVKYETAHNLQTQIDFLLEAARMCAQAASAGEARRIAEDVIAAHQMALNALGSSH